MVEQNTVYDVIVAGSGAGGLATAIAAAHAGLSVLVVEKSDKIGGTTARSGGWIWVPNSRAAREERIDDSPEKARAYIEAETGNRFDADRIDAYLKYAPEMLEFFAQNTEVRFNLASFVADYHPELPGGMLGGRALNPEPFDLARLGKHADRLASPLPELTFLGMMVGSNRELRHFFAATRSVRSFGYVAKLLARYAFERLRHGRTMRLTNGTALAAALVKSALDMGIEIRTDTTLTGIERHNGRVTGVKVSVGGGEQVLMARRGVVLATGGFPHDTELRKAHYPHDRNGQGHYSPAYSQNTGDALRASAELGAAVSEGFPHSAAWVPVSLVPRRDGSLAPFPHLVDRGKPGVIAVLKNGRRFVNEADSYHDFGAGLIAAHDGAKGPAECWLITDHTTLRRYGLGHVKPFPIPLGPALRSGYLHRASTLAELAHRTGIDPTGLDKTMTAYNQHARGTGDDPEYGRGTTGYNRYMGDPDHRPNPCVRPIEDAPFYAIRVVMGDLGSFAGHVTDAKGRVLDKAGAAIQGLYAVGNDAASIFAGGYIGAGITLGPALTFGYLAGRDLASQADTAPSCP
jgi:succinate dehydrogenase/fumarate reductase flavoprotein subunit